MKEQARIKIDKELFQSAADQANVSMMLMTAPLLQEHLKTSIYLQSTLFVLILEGSAVLEINFRKYEVSRQKIMLLSFGHFFKIEQLSDNFQCAALYVGKEYSDEMYSTDMLYQRIKYGVKMHRTPFLDLNRDQSVLLYQRMNFVNDILLNKQHRSYKEMILHSLVIFFLDLGHLIEEEHESQSKPSRDEIYFQQFLDYLVSNYKEQHTVDFYADKLNITSQYITLIVKRLSGQSVSDLIFELLFSEAKLLLKQPDLAIQQIAEQLYFSDQSAFGKFFKRKSGTSPKEFRQTMIA